MVKGRDLRAARMAAGIGLDRLAERIGRHKSHLSRVERGDREVTPALVRDYERVLGASANNTEDSAFGHRADSESSVQAIDSTDEPWTTLSRSLAVDRSAPGLERLDGLVEALIGHGDEPMDERPRLAELRSSVALAKQSYQACRYRSLLRQLPGLLCSIRVGRATAPFDRHPEIDVLAAEAHQVAGSLALKFNDTMLAALAGAASMSAAEVSGDPLAMAASARLVCHALSSAGHHANAVAYAEKAVFRLDSAGLHQALETAAVRGALLLRGTVAAARMEDRDKTAALLEEARAMAVKVKDDGNLRWTGFGPTNVATHQVHVAVALGDAGTAVTVARAISAARVDLPAGEVCRLRDRIGAVQ